MNKHEHDVAFCCAILHNAWSFEPGVSERNIYVLFIKLESKSQPKVRSENK